MNEAEYGLVMPFTVCTSKGGPYDDASFVAGYEMGLLDARLADGPARVNASLRSDSIPQIDLLAMRHGYAVATEPWEDGSEWTLCEFTKADG